MAKITSVIVPTKSEVSGDTNAHFKKVYGSNIYYISDKDAKSYAAKANLGISKSLALVSSGYIRRFKHALSKKTTMSWTIFQHDDISFVSKDLYAILDEMWLEHKADIIGVAGTKTIPPVNTGYWWYREGDFEGSGAVEHKSREGYKMCAYGPYPSRVVAVDGVWIAVRTDLLRDPRLRFDESFDGYHFYDADFCANARCLGYKIWTSRLHITHHSGGNMDSEFFKYQQLFAEKWKARGEDYHKNSISLEKWKR